MKFVDVYTFTMVYRHSHIFAEFRIPPKEIEMKAVLVDIDRCMGCYNCERVCFFQHESRLADPLARIFVHIDMDRRRIFTATCLQCETAWCMCACPVQALTHDPITQAVVVDATMCVGCGMCVVACPFGYMQLAPHPLRAVKCDLCGGSPKCVDACMAGALFVGDIDQLADIKRRRTMSRIGVRAVLHPEES